MPYDEGTLNPGEVGPIPKSDQQPMTEDDLKQLARQHIRLATDYLEGEIAEERTQAMNYYYAEKFGNEQSGRSSVVTTDVQDTIESMMPDFMEIFAGSDRICEFTPVGPEEHEKAQADQATEYVNYIWHHDNDGFGITYDFIKDSLMMKNGVISINWVDDEERREATKTGLNTMDVMALEQDPEVEILQADEAEIEEDEIQFYPDGMKWDVKMVRARKMGRVKIDNIPPENFLISPRALKGDESAPMVGARYEKTVSELIEEGFDAEIIQNIPSHDEQYYNRETQARFRNEEAWPEHATITDHLTRKVWVYDLYFHVDYDGDGMAEYRQVMCAGPGREILVNEAVDSHPFVDITPIRMPHKFFGRSIIDLIFDHQFIRSTILRQWLDNTYSINNNRSIVNSRVNMDDYLSNRVGQAIRVAGEGAVGDAYAPVVTQPLGPSLMPLLEFISGERETRTGETRYNQGMDADSLNKTATGINMIIGQAQKRKLLIARLFAETGFKRAMKKILRLVIDHQDKPRVVRLRGDYVPMDPKHWDADMDLTISVGLGHGTKQEKLQMAQARSGFASQMLQLQGNPNGPLIGMPQIFRHARDFYEATGVKNIEQYINDPGDQPMQMPKQEEKPDPAMIKARTDMKKLEQDGQIAQMDDQREREKAAKTHERELHKILLQDERERMKLKAETGMQSAKLQADARKSAEDAHRDASKAVAEARFKEEDQLIQRRGQDLEAAKADEQNAVLREHHALDDRHRHDDRESARHEKSEDRKAAKKNGKQSKSAKGGNITLNIEGNKSGKRTLKLDRDVDGNVIGGTAE